MALKKYVFKENVNDLKEATFKVNVVGDIRDAISNIIMFGYDKKPYKVVNQLIAEAIEGAIFNSFDDAEKIKRDLILKIRGL